MKLSRPALSSLQAVLALVAFTLHVCAMPTPTNNPDKCNSFSIDQVKGGTYYKSGPLARMQAYNKYNVTPPANLRLAAQKSSAGSVTANPLANDVSYICPVTVGNTTLYLDFDTGSADLWVFSDLTPPNEVNGQTEYNVDSGTPMPGYTWSIRYADGSGASGDVFADQVTVGNITATQQAVEAATSVSSGFAGNSKTDGLLGLAFSNINTVQPQKQTTFFETVQDSLSSPLFAADLKSNGPGSYDFGYIDQSKLVGDITYTDVDPSRGFWMFEADNGIGTSIMDTGTTLLLLPDEAVEQYYSNVNSAVNDSNQGGYVFSCSEVLPALELSIAGTGFVVPGDLLNYSPIDSDGVLCYGGLQSSARLGFNIFGDVFLRSFYVIFDQTQSTPRLGIANQS